jgi:uncharacterized protein (TIGR00299 family) protein
MRRRVSAERILYFDAFSGVSGDMTVGALLSLGVDLARLQAELSALPVGGYRLRAGRREVNGIGACKFDVDVDAPHGERGHAHRAFPVIRAMVEESAIRPAVRDRALAIFTRLAEAEARVHGVSLDDVHLHEVGAVDSIVDVVGTAVGLAELGVGRVFVSPLPLGSGSVNSAHGVIPVPAPATVELLRGFEVRLGDGAGELVTPTGAAIVAALAQPGRRPPPMRIEAVGYGAGTRSLPDRANLLRLVLGSPAAALATGEMVVIESNVDDANPEIYDYAMEQLFAAGARDVWLTPILMKKNRPAILVRVLADPADRDLLAGVLLRETPAIGVRFTAVERVALPREQVTVETEYGSVRVKKAAAPDGSANLAPEYEDCKHLARECGVPLKHVYQAALAAARASV